MWVTRALKSRKSISAERASGKIQVLALEPFWSFGTVSPASRVETRPKQRTRALQMGLAMPGRANWRFVGVMVAISLVALLFLHLKNPHAVQPTGYLGI